MLSKYGQTPPQQCKSTFQQALQSTTHAKQTMKKKRTLLTYGKASKIKCISMQKRGRKWNGQNKAEEYVRHIYKNTTNPALEITRIMNSRLIELSDSTQDQCDLLFSLMDILKKETQGIEDVIKTELICYPDRVPEYTKRSYTLQKLYHKGEYWCEECEQDTVVYDGLGRKVCNECGLQKTDYIGEYFTTQAYTQHADGSSKDDVNSQGSHSLQHKHIYDRMSNFKAQLRQLQGECVSALDEKVMRHMHQAALWVDKKNIDCQWVIKELKKIKAGKYIPQRQRIAAIVSGGAYTPPQLPPLIVEQLLHDFETLCKAYDKWIGQAKTKRKNFISYPFVVYQLLCRHNFQKYTGDLRLIKNTKRLEEQARVWQELAGETAFDFFNIK